jgi:hypothetical protein
MTADLPRNAFDDALASLTSWEGSGGELAAAAQAQRATQRFWNVPLPTSIMILIVSLVGVLLVAAMLPSLGRARASARRVSSEMSVPMSSAAKALESQATTQPARSSGIAGLPSVKEPGSERAVIRKVSMDLEVTDLRAAFAKAALLVSEGQGEYLESSDQYGSPEPTRGTMVLRVRGERLSSVLNVLRALGNVTNETMRGEDVTEQMVDLAARLRNERRIEQELLSLMDARKDSPLKEIIEVRNELNASRERIERLVAQSERLSRSVALATILVNLRGVDAPEEHKGIWAVFVDRLERAWEEAVGALLWSITAIVKVVVGGLVWWLLLGLGVLGIRTLVRASARRAAIEPAPRLE